MTKTSAINRIHELLDDNSFVEVGAYITARSTDCSLRKPLQMVLLPVMVRSMVLSSMCTARTRL